LFEDTEGINRYVLQPHLGLISLIAMLEQQGHTGILLDPKIQVAQGLWPLDEELYTRIASAVLAHEPDVVGMTSLGCNFICTVKVAGYLKKARPDLPILLGGPHATVLDKIILNRFPQFDAIARNEAERTIVPLIEEVRSRNLWKIPGITFRVKDTIWENAGEGIIQDLDELPIPAYHAYPIRELKLTSLRVDAGRGCPFQCTFCSTAAFFGRKYRLKSAAKLVGELDFLNRQFGVVDFALSHDLFTVNRHKVREFCDAVEGRGYTWKCSARMDCVDAELLEKMAASGCRSIYYGIESGSRRMQKIAKKHLDLSLFDPLLDVTQNLGMAATVSFITGYPEETAEDQEATLDLMASCFAPPRRRSPLNVQLHLLTPEPGTELLHQYPDKIAYDGHVSDFNFPSLEKDDAAVTEANPTVFVNHHYFPSVLPRDRHIFVTEIYQTLYALGFPLLDYMTRSIGTKFSAAVESMYGWYRSENRTGPIDGAFLEAFMAARFGPRHHLAGLVRYMLRAADLRRAVSRYPAFRQPASSPDQVYRLDSYSRIVREVPDCPKLLDYLLARPSERPPAGMIRARHNFLLQMQPGDSDTVRNFTLTDAAAAVLDSFDEPRSISEFERDFPKLTGYPAPPVAFLNTLVSRQFLRVTSIEAR
jgi:radical SAM superfamily enzyme YgiQ (UPF0313 family)